MSKYICIGELLGLCIGKKCNVKETGSCSGSVGLRDKNYFKEGTKNPKNIVDEYGRVIRFKCRFIDSEVYKVKIDE